MITEDQQNSQVDKIFRDGLHIHKDQPSKELWTRIRTDLDKDDRLIYLERKRRNLLIISGLLLFMMGLGTVYIRHTDIHFHNIQKESTKPSFKKQAYPSAGIQELINKPKSKYLVLINGNEKQDNNSLTKHKISSSLNVMDSELYSFSDKTEYTQNFITIPPPETKLDIIQTDRINFVPRPISSEEMLVKPIIKSSLNKLSITTFFSQEFAGYNLSDDDATAADGREIEKRERNAFSASMGVYLNYGINRKWVIQTGLSYSWSTSNIDSAKSFAVLDNSGNVQFKLNTIAGYGYLQYPPTVPTSLGDSVFTDKTLSRIHYLTLPVLLSFRVPLKRFSLLVGAGVSFNLLTSATLETKIYGPNLREQETVIPIKGIRNLNYGIILKADLEYHINNRVGVNVIPSFKNSISPINIHSALSAYPYNFGIGAGISYHF
jgi:hypothetical protein